MNEEKTQNQQTQKESENINPTIYDYLQIAKNFYGGFFTRTVAYLIDLIIIYLLATLLNTVTLGVLDTGKTFPVLNCSLPVAIVYIIYFITMTYIYSQTIGKMLLKIKVEKINDEKLTLADVFYREFIGRILSSALLLLPYLAVAVTDKKQGLHDYIANTVVVKEDFASLRKKINAKIKQEKEN